MSIRKRSGSLVLLLLVLTIALVVSACGEEEPETTTTTAEETTTTAAEETTTTTAGTDTTAGATTTTVVFEGEAAAVAESWTTFFAGTTPMADRIALLENGDQLAADLEALGENPLVQAVAAQVKAIDLTSDTEADVTFDILLSGAPVLTDLQGKAVKVDDVWKVSTESFQILQQLQPSEGTTTPSS